MRCDVLAVGDSHWRDFLRTTRHDVYHLPDYVGIEARRCGFDGRAVLVSDGERRLFLPYLVRDADVVSPYGYPGPLLNEAGTSEAGFLPAALRGVAELFAREGRSTAFLRLHPILSPSLASTNLPGLDLRAVPTVVVRLDRTDAEIWADTRKGHQSTINRCIRLGQTARISQWAEHRAEFLEVYRETMDQAGAADHYYFDDAYFDSLQELGDRVHLCVVETQGDLAAACLLFESGGIVHAHLGGTRERHRDQSPFSLLLHHVRLWARGRGNTRLHLGGGVGGAEDAVFRFKTGFSRDRLEYVTAKWTFIRLS